MSSNRPGYCGWCGHSSCPYDSEHTPAWCDECHRNERVEIRSREMVDLLRDPAIRDLANNIRMGMMGQPVEPRQPAPAPSYTPRRTQGRGVIPIDDN